MNKKDLKELYATPKFGCAHLSIPREGHYKIELSHRRCYYNGLPLTTTAIWKPLGSKKSDPGIEVELPMLALILNNEVSHEDRLKFLQGNLKDHILTVSEVKLKAHSQIIFNVEVKWALESIR